MANLKIPKGFVFTRGELFNYLRTVTKFNKLDFEILAVLTYAKAYSVTKGVTDVLISFPYKLNKQKEIERRPLFKAEEIGNLIQKYAEERSPIDAICVIPKNQRQVIVRPIQIKFLRGEIIDTDRCVVFLKKYLNYDAGGISLIIFLEGAVKIKVAEIAIWLRENTFPFPEVILVGPNIKTGKMTFIQVKPSNEKPKLLVFSREEMYAGTPFVVA